MSLIEIKNRVNGEVIFKHDCENNTVKITVEEAVKLKINLSGSDLSGSNLSGINLSGINLSVSNLSGSDLSGSNLSWSNLSWSNLSGSNLSWSDLSGSDLSGSDLSRSDLSRSNLSGSNLSGSDLSRSKIEAGIISTFKFFGNFGSAGRNTVFLKLEKSIYVHCGCFKGLLEDFAKKVKETHGKNELAREYGLMIAMIKKLWKIK